MINYGYPFVSFWSKINDTPVVLVDMNDINHERIMVVLDEPSVLGQTKEDCSLRASR